MIIKYEIGFFGQNGPIKILSLLQQTICEKFIYNLSDTLSINSILCIYKVKILLNMNNPQVTKALSTQVETSEAIRLLNINKNSYKKNFNE